MKVRTIDGEEVTVDHRDVLDIPIYEGRCVLVMQEGPPIFLASRSRSEVARLLYNQREEVDETL